MDSSVYIAAMRRGEDPILTRPRITADTTLWLSAVVLEELYAGVSDGHRSIVERLENHFDEFERILVPNRDDWTTAGRVLARLAAKYDYEQIGRGRLTNDALIATSAARQNIEIITFNGRDFSRLAEFRSFRWQVATF